MLFAIRALVTAGAIIFLLFLVLAALRKVLMTGRRGRP
jgi:hypothetical protein